MRATTRRTSRPGPGLGLLLSLCNGMIGSKSSVTASRNRGTVIAQQNANNPTINTQSTAMNPHVLLAENANKSTTIAMWSKTVLKIISPACGATAVPVDFGGVCAQAMILITYKTDVNGKIHVQKLLCSRRSIRAKITQNCGPSVAASEAAAMAGAPIAKPYLPAVPCSARAADGTAKLNATTTKLNSQPLVPPESVNNAMLKATKLRNIPVQLIA
mmetsp:Transcript_91191/g.142339  ORF Transcript_91191/g.142339 Transcript_91191/m.142339 type:complete len:216 (+) Transcript_91191:1219-1866(+)